MGHIELSLDEDDVREFCHNMYVYLDIRSWESLGSTNLYSVMVSNIKNA